MAAPGVTTIAGYLAKLPADRRAAIARVRDVINANLPGGFEEGLQYGMISWYVPLARYPDTYNGQPLALASLGAQKSHMALYLMSVYGSPELAAWFRGAFAAAGKRLDMGKSCVRFKSLDALPLDVIGEAIRRVPLAAYLAAYEAARAGTQAGRAARAKATPTKAKAKATPTPKTKPTKAQPQRRARAAR